MRQMGQMGQMGEMRPPYKLSHEDLTLKLAWDELAGVLKNM